MIGVGDPVWAFGPTGGALLSFDSFHLRPPFHLLIPRGRHVNRIGHVIHTTMFLEPIDRETVWQVAGTSPPRTIIDLARFETPERVSIAIDSAHRDGGTTERHLHARIAALRSKGRHRIPDLIRIIGAATAGSNDACPKSSPSPDCLGPFVNRPSPRRVTVSCGSTSGFRGLHS
jgi:hypothetical protein